MSKQSQNNQHYRLGFSRKNESGDIEFIISNESRDRHKTIIPLKNWKLDNYKKNPIVGYQHNVYGGGFFSEPNPDTIIGTSDITIEKNALVAVPKFESIESTGNELAEKISKKVEFGSLRSASVGFLELTKGKFGEGEEKKSGDEETYYYGQVELTEWSIVNIPSNTDAVKRYIQDTFGKDFDIKEAPIEDVNEVLNKEFDLTVTSDILKQLEIAFKQELITELDVKGFLDYVFGKEVPDVKCKNCSKEFNYNSVKESGMGYVKCPECGEAVTQKKYNSIDLRKKKLDLIS